MDSTAFLNGRVTLHAGDCLAVLPTLEENSIDSCVTDPPYELKFMNRAWDGTGVGFRPETWAAVLRVLKPGAHLVAFAAPKNAHRMFCAIEDGGFEIRDTIAWLFGSGFPKSHDVSKAIDRRGGAEIGWFGTWLRKWRQEKGVTQKQVAVLFPSKTGGLTGCVANWELGLNLPTPDQFNLICQTFGLPFKTLDEAKRQVIGTNANVLRSRLSGSINYEVNTGSSDITVPATDSARQWQGWGTALKPAHEPICLARKPLIGTVAENVLRHGVGAINIDGCRVETDVGDYDHPGNSGIEDNTNVYGDFANKNQSKPHALGRWPANVLTDGSDEVVEAFPDAPGQQRPTLGSEKSHTGDDNTNCYGEYGRVPSGPVRGDDGSASRFFYTAKADSDDRLGSKHPTVKPLDLMQYLVRLVTPPKGTILDPFAGTGTTGEAAWREGFNAVLIEREPEYLTDIERRMSLCLAGPDERARESIKARQAGKPQDHGPLFGEAVA